MTTSSNGNRYRNALRLAVLEERTKWQKAMTDQRFELEAKALAIKATADDLALKLATAINDKHMNDLNHQHEETRRNQGMSVSLDKFEGFATSTKKDIIELQQERSRLSGRSGVSLPIILTVINGAMAILVAVIVYSLTHGGTP